MLDTLITSKTRLKLMLKFFLNPGTSSYLRSLSEEFGDSTNAIRVELNRFEGAGMLSSEEQGNRKLFKANTSHPLYRDVHNMLLKFTGLDQIVETVVDRLGNVKQVYLEGSLADGVEGDVIDLVFVGSDIDRGYLTNLIEKVEKHLNKHIRYVLLDEYGDAQYFKNKSKKPLLLWSND